VVLVGLLLGAGLPALFAAGLRLLGAGTTLTTDESGTVTTNRNPLAVAGAIACFAVVVIAIVTGILFIMSDFLANTFGIELF
jgi:hypothetical protein